VRCLFYASSSKSEGGEEGDVELLQVLRLKQQQQQQQPDDVQVC
jgi:hypothetical protein